MRKFFSLLLAVSLLAPAFSAKVNAESPSELVVSSPTLGATWYTGKTYEIKWDKAALGSDRVNISLHNANCINQPCIALAPYQIATSASNTGSYLWAIPQDLISFYKGKQYLQITAANGARSILSSAFAVEDVSPPTRINVTSPMTGDSWKVGETYSIRWSITGSTDERVDIFLSPYYSCFDSTPACLMPVPMPYSIARNVSNSGSFTWTIPTDLPNVNIGTQRIMVNLSNGQMSGQSGTFVISTAGTLDIRANGFATGIVWQDFSAEFEVVGGSAPYNWEVSGNLPAGLKLQPGTFNCITTPCIPPPEHTARMYLSGILTHTGSFSYKLIVKDSSGKMGSKEFITQIYSGREGNIDIGSPHSKDQWEQGATYPIMWKGTEKRVSITLWRFISCLYDRPSVCKVAQPIPYNIAEGVSGGQYLWKVPVDNLAVSSGQYYILVEEIGDAGYTVGSGKSGKSGVFDIVEKGISQDLRISTSSPLKGSVGRPFSAEFMAQGGLWSYSWSVNGSLPPGLRLTQSSTPIPLSCSVPSYPLATGQTSLVQPDMACCAYPAIQADERLSIYPTPLPRPCPPIGMAKAIISGVPTRAGNYAFALMVKDGSGKSVEEKFSINIASSSIASLEPASLVRTPGRAIHLILDNNQYYTFSSFVEFVQKGYRNILSKSIVKDGLTGFTETRNFERPSGTTFKYAGERTIYYLTKEKCKQAYASLGTFRAWRLSLSNVVAMPATEEFPTCASSIVRVPEGTAVKAGDPTVYVLEDGQLRPVASAKSFTSRGYSFSQVFEISEGEKKEYMQGAMVE